MEQSQNLSSFRRAFVILCCAACALWVAEFLCYFIPCYVIPYNDVFYWIRRCVIGMVMPLCFVALFFLNMKVASARATKVAFIVSIVYAVLSGLLRIWRIIYEDFYYYADNWSVVFDIVYVISIFVPLLLIIAVAFFAESQIKNKLVLSTSVVYMLCSFVWAIRTSRYIGRFVYDFIPYDVGYIILAFIPTILLFAAATTIVKKQKTINRA